VDCFESVVSLLALILAAISIGLLFVMECIRRPFLEFIPHRDEMTSERYMWYHLKIKNKKPRIWFNRDAAIECIAMVSFLNKNTKEELVPQIEARWTNQVFDSTQISVCQRKNVGFRPEKFDILIKYAGDSGFYAVDPWVVHCYSKGQPKYEKLRVDTDESIIKVEIEAINLGRRQEAEFLLKNKGTRPSDIEIILLKNEYFAKFVPRIL